MNGLNAFTIEEYDEMIALFEDFENDEPGSGWVEIIYKLKFQRDLAKARLKS